MAITDMDGDLPKGGVEETPKKKKKKRQDCLHQSEIALSFM